MTFIDLFAGIGGFRKGLELAGHKCLGSCEFDKFAVQSYRAIHNTEGEWYAKDIRTVRAADIPRADIWCAGFPCQDISVAGKQLGFKGKRSSLFFTVTGLVAGLEEKDKPRILLFENVKNLLSVNRGFDFARLLIELDEIGYDAEWAVLNSSDVVPQNRARIFIVGCLRSRHGRKVFPIRESNHKTNELHRHVCNTIIAGQRHTVGTYVIESERNAQEVIYQRARGNNNGGIHEIAPTLTSNCYENNNLVVKQVGDTIAVPCLTPDRAKKRQNGRRFKNNNNPMFTLTNQDRHGVAVGSLYTQDSPDFHKGPLKEKSRCLKANKHDAELLFTTDNIAISANLLPLECWRLQGWDDEDFFRAFFLDKELAHKFNTAYQRHQA